MKNIFSFFMVLMFSLIGFAASDSQCPASQLGAYQQYCLDRNVRDDVADACYNICFRNGRDCYSYIKPCYEFGETSSKVYDCFRLAGDTNTDFTSCLKHGR